MYDATNYLNECDRSFSLIGRELRIDISALASSSRYEASMSKHFVNTNGGCS